MLPGLTDREISLLREAASRQPRVRGVFLYGSRARGTHRPGSDVDLALRGDVTPAQARDFCDALNQETDFPYLVDAVAYDALPDGAFKREITAQMMPLA